MNAIYATARDRNNAQLRGCEEKKLEGKGRDKIEVVMARD